MAQQDIVGGIFGLTPEMYQQGLARQTSRDNMATAQLTPGQLSGFYAMEAGSGLGRAAQGLLGVEDPELAKIRDVQSMRGQFDVTTPEGLRQFAQALSAKGYTDLASQAAMEADKRGLTQAQTVRALREPNVNAFEKLLSSGKYTPASIAKYKDSQNPADLVLVKGAAGEGGEAGAGPVGKTGAYRNVYGEIIPGSEMSKQRLGFQKAEQLLDNLNSITLDDIKKSESWLDWTSGENKKQIGGKVAKETVAAQSKINASALLKQIESLPPGSASNADMAAAKSSFPGYGNADNLEKWVNETKTTLANSLARQSEQYGFNQKVQAKQDYSADYAKYQAKYGSNAKYKSYSEYAAARSGK